MGQSLPLPEKIPYPKAEVRSMMETDGIKLLGDAEYVAYTLPPYWKMRDVSTRQDLPDYYIVDEDNYGRYHIHGAWKGTYDNKLYIQHVKEKRLIEPNHEGMEECVTSGIGYVKTLAEGLDPKKRPANWSNVPNEKDFSTSGKEE